MAGKRLKWWFDAVCTILVLAGVVFASFGLDILPVERSVLLKWGSGIYRSLMMAGARLCSLQAKWRSEKAIVS
jgi:protein-S-isoprenylcysteine O-methyltransferase Ste14